MTKAEEKDKLYTDWLARIEEREKPKGEAASEDKSAAYVCLRCGGVFNRITPPKRCPACNSEKWLDDKAKFRKRRRIG